jgi:hypothetical protein
MGGEFSLPYIRVFFNNAWQQSGEINAKNPKHFRNINIMRGDAGAG